MGTTSHPIFEGAKRLTKLDEEIAREISEMSGIPEHEIRLWLCDFEISEAAQARLEEVLPTDVLAVLQEGRVVLRTKVAQWERKANSEHD